MRFFSPVLFVSALVFGFVPTPAIAQGSAASPAASGATGNWELTITTPQDVTTVNLTLQQDGEKLTGSLSGRMGTVPVTGAMTPAGLSVMAAIEVQGGRLAVNIDGTVEGDALKGTVAFGDMGQFPFTGKRVAATAAATTPAPSAAAAAPTPAPAPAPADAATVAAGAAGKWNIVISLPGMGEFPVSANFTQDPAGVVGGTLTSAAGDVSVAGTMTGTTLKLDFNATTPQGDIPIVMTGELTSAGLSGKATIVGMGEADWTGTRVP